MTMSTYGLPTSSSVTGLSSISGVASGLNFNSIVSQLMAVEQQKIVGLQNQQTALTNQQNAMNQLSGYLSTLQTQAQSMANSSSFLSYTTSMTSNGTAASSLLSAQTSSTATAGSHTIVVNTLAQAEKIGSNNPVVNYSTGTAATSSTTALGMSGSFTVNGQTVTVASSDSLQSIADNINLLDTGSNATGVTASVMNVGTNDYRLVLTNDATGTANPIALAGADLSSATALADLQLATPSTLVAAQDATATVDGYAVTSSTNTISNAISGVTLNLTQADPATTVTLNVGVDTAAVTQNVQAFVDDYNKVMDFINQQMQNDPKTNTSGPLATDSLVRTIQSEMSSSLLQSIPGLSSTYNSLVMIGVTPDSTGHLSIDSTTLNSLLSTNPDAVKDVFAATGTSTNSALSFLNYGSGTVSGSYAVNVTQAASQASATGTALGGSLSAADGVTITDGMGQQAQFTTANGNQFTSGETLTQIVSAMNAEFAKTYTQQVTQTAFAAGTTSATTLSSLGFTAGDTITIGGVDRNGGAVSSTYTVGASDTVATLLSSIQYAYNQQATATVDASGNIVLTDSQSGQSSLNLSLTNSGTFTGFGGGSSITTTGRYAMDLTASATTGGALQLINNAYGSTSSFTVNETADALGFSGTINTSAYSKTYTGTDVAGTIGGLAATGSGQVLTGTAGNASGMSLMYTGTATGAVGSLTASLGVGALYDNMINTLTTAGTGLVSTDIASMQTNYDNLTQDIANVQAQMNQEQATLLSQFQAMESAIASLNTTGSYLTQLSSMLSNSSGSTSTSSFK